MNTDNPRVARSKIGRRSFIKNSTVTAGGLFIAVSGFEKGYADTSSSQRKWRRKGAYSKSFTSLSQATAHMNVVAQWTGEQTFKKSDTAKDDWEDTADTGQSSFYDYKKSAVVTKAAGSNWVVKVNVWLYRCYGEGGDPEPPTPE